jgi:hypothetical protein
MSTGELDVVEVLVLLGVVFTMWGALLLPDRSERDPNERAGKR